MSEPFPDGQKILEMTSGFMSACAIGAGAELNVFTELDTQPATAEQLAERLDLDVRSTSMLLDSLAALRLLEKREEIYSVPADSRDYLIDDSPRTMRPMLLHRMNILRSWAQLAWVTKAGFPPPRTASIRGPEADRAAFIAAMHSVSGPVADGLIARLGPLDFNHLLDVGGASGTWTLALLRAVPSARATIFDLPDALVQARERIVDSEFADRITLIGGDFYDDVLPPNVDFALVSAIAHQHSRHHNRDLFAKVHTALVPGGRIMIRDVVMQPNRTQPVFGALFAINMLVHTDTGGVFTFDEYREDLESVGFVECELRIHSDDMNSVIVARRG